MNRELQKLIRLVEVHSQLMEWHLENLDQLDLDLSECNTQHQRALHSLDQLQQFGIVKGPNFSRIFRDLQIKRDKISAATKVAKTEHARLSIVNAKLGERQTAARQAIAEAELAQSVDDWNNAIVQLGTSPTY